MNPSERYTAMLEHLFTTMSAPVLATPWQMIFTAGFLGIALWVVGRRLGCLAKPDRPYLSPVVRFIGNSSCMIGRLVSAVCYGWVALVLALQFISQFLSGVTFLNAWANSFGLMWKSGQMHLLGLLGGSFVGAAISLPIIWRVIPKWERGKGLPDVLELVKTFKQFDAFNPVSHIDVRKGCLIGRTSQELPLYIPWRKLRETHIQVLGMTGSGKGVAMSLVAFQCVLAGECLIWFDPKYDRYSPRIIRAAAEQAGRPFHFINLNPGNGPQLNPLMGASAYEIEELLIAAFDLRNKGTDGDFYRGKDEDAAAEAARIAIDSGSPSITNMLKACATASHITEQENFWRKLKKLARLSAIQTESGLDLVDVIASGAAIYVVGSADSESVKMLQKLLLVRVMQIIKARDRLTRHAPTCIVLDEFKHMLSPAAFTSLGVVRDFDTHILLAHQSLGDLSACPGIETAEAHGAVVDNTAIKIVYKIGDDTYAERLARMSGKRRTYVDNSSKQLDESGIEGGSWREDEVHHMDMDLITHLPMPSDRPKQASVGVLFGVGNAQLFHVGPLPVSGDMPTPKLGVPSLTSVDVEAELI